MCGRLLCDGGYLCLESPKKDEYTCKCMGTMFGGDYKDDCRRVGKLINHVVLKLFVNSRFSKSTRRRMAIDK